MQLSVASYTIFMFFKQISKNCIICCADSPKNEDTFLRKTKKNTFIKEKNNKKILQQT